ncbi:MAG TPA: glycyl-radical enzyme activating protein [Candidatus Aminicenantes bacterium]|nr:glycyl-radical enzyme activating protein [Candidatus Aminicenantes bacterium]
MSRLGTVFDIRRYSVHDGPGIRTTVFFKGCPLRCPWCHNPEGLSQEIEIMVKAGLCIAECRECLAACRPKALSKSMKSVRLNRALCTLCGECAEVCPTEAVRMVGRRMTVSEVMTEVEKDRVFYGQSGGGVTFSGGEPLLQPQFLREVLDACRERGFHTAVDTCGFASPEIMADIARRADLFLYDVKLIDDSRHRKIVGESNGPILDNLRGLVRLGKDIMARIPLVAGVNSDEASLREMADFLESVGGIRRISLLPYHALGKEKSWRLHGKRPAVFQAPPEEFVAAARKELEKRGFEVVRGE